MEERTIPCCCRTDTEIELVIRPRNRFLYGRIQYDDLRGLRSRRFTGFGQGYEAHASFLLQINAWLTFAWYYGSYVSLSWQLAYCDNASCNDAALLRRNMWKGRK